MKNLTILLCLLLAACSSVNIKNVNHANNFTLSNYKTFGFYGVDASGDALGPDYASNLELLKKAITEQFAAKGILPATDTPDLMVNIGIVVSNEVQTRETSFTPGDRTAYMGQRNYSWHSEEVVIGSYKQGSVTVDLVDRGTNKLVWQGTAESIVPSKESKVPALIDEGMRMLFTKLK